jgi:proline dehydrogenase
VSACEVERERPFGRPVSATAPTLQRLLFPLATRFVAGDSVADALRTVERLADAGLAATVAALGEDIASDGDADHTRDEYRRLIDGLAGRSLAANLSLKLSALGTKLGGEGFVQRYVEVVGYAAEAMRDPFVRVDMEGSSTIDQTLDAVTRTFAMHANTGPVLQASLRRTVLDVAAAAAHGMRVRLCKGAYAESAEVAIVGADEIRANYLACATLLLRDGTFPAFATHDPLLIRAIRELADRFGVAKDAFEFQMLYGVRPDLQRSLVREGYGVRVYVPYGTQWAKYFRRRMMERRENLVFALRSVIARER